MAKQTKAGRILAWVYVLVFIGTACNPIHKVQRAIVTLNNYPEYGASYCSGRFPAKEHVIYRDSIVLDTIYVDGEVVTDTLYRHDTTIITRTSPSKIITKTVVKYKEVQVENTARVKEKENLYLACEDRYQKLYLKWELTDADRRSWRSKFWWVLLVAAGAVIGYLTKQPWWSRVVKQIQKQIKK